MAGINVYNPDDEFANDWSDYVLGNKPLYSTSPVTGGLYSGLSKQDLMDLHNMRNSFSYTDANGDTQYNWGNIASAGLGGLQALTGLANTYGFFRNLGLAKKQFDLQKANMNRNIKNQAQLINNQLESHGNIAMGLAGTNLSASDRAAMSDRIKSGYVDGSSIG